MQKGKQLGEYSFKSGHWRVYEGGKLEIDWEGTATGYGVVISTMTLPSGKTGRYDLHAVYYHDDGTIGTSSLEGGEYDSVGLHKWATTGVLKVKADGREFFLIEEGTAELVTKTWIGKFYEAIKRKNEV